ncbi:MAG: hypothetical protein RR232_01105 [Clostridia bacterium]
MMGKYVTAMFNNISGDRKLFYLPRSLQVRAIAYNKTLFVENDWMVSKKFIKSCDKTGVLISDIIAEAI